MGMSASQARYIMISGEQNDVEYQGQQINQQRTTLTTETSALNSQLMNITVPTPPSSDEYTKTSYSFTNADSNAATITGTKSNGDGTWTLNYTEAVTKDQGQYGSSNNFKTDASGVVTIGLTTVYSPGQVDLTAYTTFPPAATKEAATTNESNINLICNDLGISQYSDKAGVTGNLSRINSDSNSVSTDEQDNITKATGTAYKAGATYYSYSSTVGTGATAVTTKYYVTNDEFKAATATTPATTIKGHAADTAKTQDTVGLTPQENEFYAVTSGGTTLYYPKAATSTLDTEGKVNGYKVQKNASVNESYSMDNCAIHWAASGRMSSIDQLDGKGNILQTYDLSVSTTNDNTAYQDAYNEYEYQKQEYSSKIDSINAKISIVQGNDKKLELKLQDLDTKQKALSTEMDSVKKVIDKNIESSFKAFA